MDLEAVRSFLEVATQGSLARAAPRLFLSTSALSRRIAKLERELGSDLLERNGRTVVLTPLGAEFVTHARRLISAYEDFLDFTGRTAGAARPTRVGIAPAMAPWVRDRLFARLRAADPDTRIALVPGPNLGLIRKLLQGDLDTALLHQAPVSPALQATLVLSARILVALPRESPFASRPVLTLADLAPQPFVTSSSFQSGNPDYYARVRALLEEAGVDKTIDVGGADLMAIREHVSAGSGFTLATRWPEGASGNHWDDSVVLREAVDLDLTLETYVAWNRERVATDPVLAARVAPVTEGFPES